MTTTAAQAPCTHRLGGDPAGLVCDRGDAHDHDATGGHTYSASWAPDAVRDEEVCR